MNAGAKASGNAAHAAYAARSPLGPDADMRTCGRRALPCWRCTADDWNAAARLPLCSLMIVPWRQSKVPGQDDMVRTYKGRWPTN